MKYFKLFFVLLFTFIGLIVLTLGWVYWIGRGNGPGVAVDVTLVMLSPGYWLAFAGIVALSAWLCRRWVFVGQ